MKRVFYFGLGCIAYLSFCISLITAFVFVGDFMSAKPADSTGDISSNVLYGNLLLLSLPVILYRLMLNAEVRKSWRKYIPQPLRRSMFVLLWSLSIIIVCINWQPMGNVVWHIKKGLLHDLLAILFIGGWMLSVLSTFLINHFDFFGLRQVWLYYQGKKYETPKFKTPMIQQIAHHPMFLGLFIAFWATPVMTSSHLLISVLISIFLLAVLKSREKISFNPVNQLFKSYRNFVSVLPGTDKRSRAA